MSMVCFEITARAENGVTYAYYPEGDQSATPGVIQWNTVTGQAALVTPAQGDQLRGASAEDLNALRTAINETRKEAGLAPLTDEELPRATTDQSWYAYADHAFGHGATDLFNGLTDFFPTSGKWSDTLKPLRSLPEPLSP